MKFLSRKTRRDTRVRSVRRKLPLRLEQLEARLVLSTFTVINTNDSGTGSLRQAILDTNADLGGDIIQFASGVTGTITLTSGELDITAAVDLQGPGAGVVTVSGNNASRVFSVSANATISGLTITGGSADYGAGVLNAGTLTVNGSSIRNNISGYSGFHGSPAGGAGIYNASQGTLFLTDSSVAGNVTFGADGGGIYNLGTVTVAGDAVEDNAVEGNSAVVGGGIDNLGKLAVIDSSFDSDFSWSGGGGIDNSGTLTLANSTITFNNVMSAEGSGGIYSSGSMTCVNSTIAYNHIEVADYLGPGAGLDSTGATCILDNTIVAQNGTSFNAGSTESDIAGTVSPPSAHNLIGPGGSGGLENGVNGNLVGVADPGFGSETSLGPKNGIPTTEYVPLLPGSPAIGAGSVALAVDPASGQSLTTDQRGPGFARIVSGAVDIGAFESPATSKAASAPTITRAQILTAGMGKKQHLAGFALFCNEPLNATRARNTANYTVIQTVKHRRKSVAQRVTIQAKYQAGSETVSLTLENRLLFALGGQIVVNASPPNGITSTSGAYLNRGSDGSPGSNAVFFILPNGGGVVR